MTPRLSLLCLFFALAALGAGAEERGDALGAEDRRQFADGLFSRDLYERAAVEYESLVRDFPEADELDVALFRWAEALRLSKRPREADSALLQIVKRFPRSPYRHRAMFQRGAIAIEQDHFEVAAEMLDMLLLENPESKTREPAHYFRAEALAQSGQTKEAIKLYRSFLEEFPRSALADYARLSLGRILTESGGDTERAEAHALFRETAKEPSTPRLGAEALYLIAQSAFAHEKYDASAQAFFELAERYPEDERAADTRLQAAWAAYRAKLHAEVIDMTASALKDDSLAQRDEWVYLLGASQYHLAHYKECILSFAEFKDSLGQSRYAGAAAYQTAVSYRHLGEPAKATEAALAVPRDDPLRQDVLWLLGECFADMKDSDRAVQYYKLLADEFPESPRAPEALYRLAHQLQMREVWLEAAASYNLLAELSPKHKLAPRALFAAGYCLMKAERPAEAVRDWDKLIKEYPEAESIQEAVFRKGIEEIRLGRHDDALVTIEGFLRDYPDSTHLNEALFWHATLLQRKGDIPEAERILRKVLESAPARDLEREAVFLLGIVAQQANKDDDAADNFQKLVDDPLCERFTPKQLAWLADHQYRKGAFAESRAAAARLVEQAPDDGWRQAAWTLAGRAALGLKDREEAERAFRSAIGSSSETRYAPEAYLRLGDILLESRRIPEAEDAYRKAAQLSGSAELQPIRILSHAGLGRALKESGKREEAARYLLGFCLLNQDDNLLPPLMAETIALLEELGRDDEAGTLREDLLELYPQSRAAKELRGESLETGP